MEVTKSFDSSRLDERQRTLIRALDEDAIVAILQRLCRIPSVTGNEQEAAMFLARQAEQLGFDVNVYQLRGYGIPSPGRPNVVCRLPGSGDGPSLMLYAHTDTEKISPRYEDLMEDPFSGEIRDGYIYGLGVYNAKAPAVAFLYVLKALRDIGFTPKGDILYAATVGEMDAATGPRYLVRNGIVADMGICGLPTDFSIPTAHAGCLDIRISLQGQPGHINWPEKGQSVAPMLSKLISELPNLKIAYDSSWEGILEPRWNVSYVNGGHEYRTGVLLDECEVGMCVRAPLGSTPMTIKRDLEQFLAGLAADSAFNADLSILNPIPGFSPGYQISPDEFIVKAVARAHEAVTGDTPFVGVGPLAYGYTDAAAFSELEGMPSTIYGAGGEVGVHGEPEKVKIEDVVTAARVYALSALAVGQSEWEGVRGNFQLRV